MWKKETTMYSFNVSIQVTPDVARVIQEELVKELGYETPEAMLRINRSLLIGTETANEIATTLGQQVIALIAMAAPGNHWVE